MSVCQHTDIFFAQNRNFVRESTMAQNSSDVDRQTLIIHLTNKYVNYIQTISGQSIDRTCSC